MKCGDWIIEFGSGQGFVSGVWQNSVDVHMNSRRDFHVKKQATITAETIERMKRVVGATAYSSATASTSPTTSLKAAG